MFNYVKESCHGKSYQHSYVAMIISASQHTARRAACVKLARLQLKQAVQLFRGLGFLVDNLFARLWPEASKCLS